MPKHNPRTLSFSRYAGVLVAAGTLAVAIGRPAAAIMVYGSMDRNTDAPTGVYADSGWQYRANQLYTDSTTGGQFTNDTPWPISPHWAIRAKHTIGGGTVTAPILYNGQTYNVVQTVLDPNSDLALVRVDQPFSSYAPLYNASEDDPIGQQMMVIGYGYDVKDQEIHSLGTNRLNGWTFADGGKTFSWGLNQVESIQNVFGTQTLYATFDAPTLDNGSPNPHSMGADEAMAGFGDSGGGVFIKQNGQWCLAGDIYAIDAGVYYDKTSGDPWTGAIFDARDLYSDPPPGQTDRVLLSGPDPIPLGFYSTDLSEYRSWIDTVTGETAVVVPEASTIGLLALGVITGGILVGRRRRQWRR